MAIEPVTRKERILSGEDIEPVTRLEYFLKNSGGGGGEDSLYIGSLLITADMPPLPEGYIMAEVYGGEGPAMVYFTRSDDDSVQSAYVAYPSMQEVKPAFLINNNNNVFETMMIKRIYYEQLVTAHPVAEDTSQNRAYLTLNTDVQPLIMFSFDGGNIIVIEKSNLKWILSNLEEGGNL